jgi:threonine/homoserine/homoserine lactone efflux protein
MAWCSIFVISGNNCLAAIKIDAKSTNLTPMKLFTKGLVVQLANPKVLMYFSVH